MTHFLSRKRCVSPLLPSLRNAHPRRWPTWSATWFPDDRKLIFFRNFHFFIAPHCPTRRKRRKTSGSFPHGNMWGACVGGHNCHLSRTHTRAFFFCSCGNTRRRHLDWQIFRKSKITPFVRGTQTNIKTVEAFFFQCVRVQGCARTPTAQTDFHTRFVGKLYFYPVVVGFSQLEEATPDRKKRQKSRLAHSLVLSGVSYFWNYIIRRHRL